MTYPPPPQPSPSDPTQPFNPDQPYQPPAAPQPVSGQPYAPPAPPTYTPGSAAPPPAYTPGSAPAYPAQPYGDPYAPPPPGYPATTAFPPYGPVQPGDPGKGGPRRRGNGPLIAVIAAVALLLCGGVGVAGALLVNQAVDKAGEVVDALPTDVPEVPLPSPDDLPSDPGVPGVPGVPGNSGKTATVVYEVTGDGPADITYLEQSGKAPKTVRGAELPWRVEVQMDDVALVTVFAIRSGTSSGEVSCRALVDGEEVAQKTADGSFALVNCTKLIFN